ncbi:hypothetical protein ABC255_14110 [Neobacillus sp. 3P2-tot-E-2]|uniref:hypothetical protein n=1 Tax=Neobacillus sp. 3P2-tot-E-2 TaxID=3132212 RepID=UPI00399EFF91
MKMSLFNVILSGRATVQNIASYESVATLTGGETRLGLKLVNETRMMRNSYYLLCSLWFPRKDQSNALNVLIPTHALTPIMALNLCRVGYVQLVQASQVSVDKNLVLLPI